MGLDTVELVMEVEQTFAITIDDHDASEILTVGDLYRYVLKELEGEDSDVCLTAATFYRFRRALMEGLGVDRDRVRTSTPVEDLIPVEDRQENWQLVADRLGLRLPDLRRSRELVMALALIYFAFLVAMLSSLVKAIGIDLQIASAGDLIGVAILLSISLFLVYTALALRMTEYAAVHFAPDHGTVRGLVRAITLENYGRICARERRWNRREVWEALHSLVVKQLGARPEQVTEGARFVDDLGAD
jgi:acyl carrier protein